MKSECYLLRVKLHGEENVYCVANDGVKTVLLFENRDDAERYVIMLEQDPEYMIGDSVEINIAEYPLEACQEVFRLKKYSYVYITSDDLFVPPPAKC